MEAIRKGLFETNSSSTHSLIVAAENEFNKWVNGECLYHPGDGEFVAINKIISKIIIESDWGYKEGFDNYVSKDVLFDVIRRYVPEYVSYNQFVSSGEMIEKHKNIDGKQVVALSVYKRD